jgi:hypothetical protein
MITLWHNAHPFNREILRWKRGRSMLRDIDADRFWIQSDLEALPKSDGRKRVIGYLISRNTAISRLRVDLHSTAITFDEN